MQNSMHSKYIDSTPSLCSTCRAFSPSSNSLVFLGNLALLSMTNTSYYVG